MTEKEFNKAPYALLLLELFCLLCNEKANIAELGKSILSHKDDVNFFVGKVREVAQSEQKKGDVGFIKQQITKLNAGGSRQNELLFLIVPIGDDSQLNLKSPSKVNLPRRQRPSSGTASPLRFYTNVEAEAIKSQLLLDQANLQVNAHNPRKLSFLSESDDANRQIQGAEDGRNSSTSCEIVIQGSPSPLKSVGGENKIEQPQPSVEVSEKTDFHIQPLPKMKYCGEEFELYTLILPKSIEHNQNIDETLGKINTGVMTLAAQLANDCSLSSEQVSQLCAAQRTMMDLICSTLNGAESQGDALNGNANNQQELLQQATAKFQETCNSLFQSESKSSSRGRFFAEIHNQSDPYRWLRIIVGAIVGGVLALGAIVLGGVVFSSFSFAEPAFHAFHSEMAGGIMALGTGAGAVVGGVVGMISSASFWKKTSSISSAVDSLANVTLASLDTLASGAKSC